MAKIDYLVDISLEQNELQNAVIHTLGTAPGSPKVGQLYFNTGNDNIYCYTSGGWVDLTTQGAGVTNLGINYTTTTVEITSSTGTSATIALADGTTAGVSENNLTDAMVTKLNNLSGTNTGDQTATLIAGVGLSGTTYTPSTSTTFNLDFTELTDMTASIAGTTEFILNNAGTESRKAASEIGLQFFDNTTSAFTSNLGTVTSVTGGNGLTGSVTTSGSLNVGAGTGITVNADDVAINYLGTSNFIDSATNLEGTAIASGDTIIYHDATDNNVKKGFVSDLPFLTSIAANSITNTHLADMAGFSVKAKPTTGTGNPTDLVLGTNKLLGRLSGDITGIDIINDDTMGTATDSNIPTADSVVQYVQSQIIGGMKYKGGFNPSTDTPDLNTITSDTGDTYTATASGTYTFTTGSITLEIGDVIIAEADGILTNANQWTVINRNLQGDFAVAASETQAGIIEIATQAEVDAGTDDARAVTPAKLAAWQTNQAVVTKAAYDLADATSGVARANVGGETTFTVSHNMGSQDLTYSIRRLSDNYMIDALVWPVNANAVNVVFNDESNTNDNLYRLTITI